jgi:DHA1 family tetracycline resistance protein-like MFS transporter
MEQLNTGQIGRSNSAATFPLLLLILIDSMGFGILTPLLASALAPDSDLAICQGFSEDHRYLIYGFATGLYPMMIFFAAPLLGQLSDRVGRKTILQVCAAGIALGYVVVNTAFALGSVLLLMTGRVLGGATAGSRAISMAALADVCSPRNKDFWLSMGLLASSAGFVIGAALSGLLANNLIVAWFTIHTPLHATVLLASLDFVLLSFLFRESPRPHSVKQTPLSFASGVLSLVSAFRKPGLREVSWVFLLQSLARGAYFFFIAHFIMDAFDVTSTHASFFMSLMGFGPCISFAVLMPLLRTRYSTRAVASWSLLATAVLIVASAIAPTMMLEWCLILPISITLAISYASLVILFTDLATQDTKGEILGVTVAIKAFAFGMIAFAGGGMQTFDESVPLIASSLLMISSWIVFQTQKPQTAIQEVGSQVRVAKA